ncbi:hypothetical protein ABW19_dt0209581 [Dactylella cylindrospora]|nr:hypothetical protein ABW19_dt0209581 [Dactylella cylindrospora]
MAAPATTISITGVPLTTLFIPSSTCSTDYVVYSGDTRSTVRQAWAYTFAISSPSASIFTNSNCEPPNISSVLRRTRQSAFSPGICPSGFTTATSSYVDGVMRAYCCLDGYKIEGSLDGRYFAEVASEELVQCRGYITTAAPVKVVAPADSLSGVLEAITTRVFDPPFVVEHDALSVAWRAEELDVFPAEAIPTFNTAVVEERLAWESLQSGSTGTESDLPQETGIKLNSAPEETSGSEVGGAGLSNGAKIGIGVGAGLGGLIVLALLTWFIWTRRRKNQEFSQNHAAGYGIDKADGMNHFGGIDEAPNGVGGITYPK